MLNISYMGWKKKSMSVNYKCAKQVSRLAIQDLTPRWLNIISGAQALIPIENTPREGVNRCMANLMINDAGLKTKL